MENNKIQSQEEAYAQLKEALADAERFWWESAESGSFPRM